MTFFPADTPDAENPFEHVHGRTPWFEPPRDEQPALFAASEIIARSGDVVIALSGVRVYSDGVELLIDRHLRRGSRNPREWQLAQMDFSSHWGPAMNGGDRLRFGVVLGDGERVFSDGPFTPPDPQADDAHTLRMTGGGGSGGDDTSTMRDGLWLHPLPPEGPLEVVLQWPAFGIAESRVIVDGGQLRTLAASVHPLWD